MKPIPTQFENPKGLHQRYAVKKLIHRVVPMSYYNGDLSMSQEYDEEVMPDPGAEYFVMRLDEGGKDLNHIKACRIGIHAYADAIETNIPELAKDLRERYPLL